MRTWIVAIIATVILLAGAQAVATWGVFPLTGPISAGAAIALLVVVALAAVLIRATVQHRRTV
jgi:hypothetical protein